MSNLIFNSALYGPVAFIPYPVTDGATETLEFATDLLPSFTNEAEERNQMRALPRQTFQYAYKASFGFQQEIFNAIVANIRGNWLVPLWFEAQPVSVANGQTTIAVDTTVHDLRAPSHALLFQSICKWQVVTISALTSDSITCTAATLNGLVYVVPFRLGKFSGQSTMSPTGYNNSIKTLFDVKDVLSGLTDVVSQYNGLDLYTIPYLKDGESNTQVNWDENTVDFLTGAINRSTVWGKGQYSKDYTFAGKGQDNLRALKGYFYRRAGKFRPFYSPSFESNLNSESTGNVGTAFKFRDEGYTDNLFQTRKTIGFELIDGSWLIRNVIAATHLGAGVDQITLNAALNVDASRIALASFVGVNRLDTDRLEISLGTSHQFRAQASVMEISP